jgi:hypothetical protein
MSRPADRQPDRRQQDRRRRDRWQHDAVTWLAGLGAVIAAVVIGYLLLEALQLLLLAWGLRWIAWP